MENVYYVGMDVHKDSIRMAVLQGNERSTVYEGTYENDVPKIIRRLKSFAKKGTVIAAYEADTIQIPTQDDEAARDLLRCREDIKIEESIIALAQAEPYREKVARLRCLKGIDYLTALACVCEVGDYRRFPSAGLPRPGTVICANCLSSRAGTIATDTSRTPH